MSEATTETPSRRQPAVKASPELIAQCREDYRKGQAKREAELAKASDFEPCQCGRPGCAEAA